MKKFILPEDLGNAVGEYLASRPYREVAGLLNAFSQLEEVDEAQGNYSDRIAKDNVGGKQKST